FCLGFRVVNDRGVVIVEQVIPMAKQFGMFGLGLTVECLNSTRAVALLSPCPKFVTTGMNLPANATGRGCFRGILETQFCQAGFNNAVCRNDVNTARKVFVFVKINHACSPLVALAMPAWLLFSCRTV